MMVVISSYMNSNAIAYIRVSTDKQGRSGLGLESQRKAIEDFCATEGLNLRDTYVEVETGKGADALDRRPQSGGRIAYRLDVSCAHHRGPARSFEQGCPFHFQPDVEKGAVRGHGAR